MVFQSRDDVTSFTNTLKNKNGYLGEGAQAKCYTDFKNVYKLYKGWNSKKNVFFASKEHILRFKEVNATTIIFPSDVIEVDDKPIGEIMRYASGVPIGSVDPLTVPISLLKSVVKPVLRDIAYISKYGIRAYDIKYNIVLSDRMSIIDTTEYAKRGDYENIEEMNRVAFSKAIIDFLVEGYFIEALNTNIELLDLYLDGNDLLLFIDKLKDYLSTLVGHEIETLGEAKDFVMPNQSRIYVRDKTLVNIQNVIKNSCK